MFVTVLALSFCLDIFGVAAWNYDSTSDEGPSKWKNTYPDCGKSKQSPIDIVEETDVKYNSTLKPLTLRNFTATSGYKYEIVNNGHSVQINIEGDSAENKMIIEHNGVSYQLGQFHFHFGSNDSQGSEHKLNGEVFPAEMHMVHFNTKYPDLATAATKNDGLLVWGHFIKDDGATSMDFEKFVKYLPAVTNKDAKKTIPVFPISTLIPTDSVGNYFTYPGSLTTPGCYESVVWVVNSKFIVISSAQMQGFRKLKTEHKGKIGPLWNNYRPVQALNGRNVEKSFDSSSSTGNRIAIMSSFFLIVILTFWKLF